MSSAALAQEADARDPFATTRENYQRFAFLLIRQGHVPEVPLTHLEFRVLLFLLSQKPGEYAAHHSTIARACETNVSSVRDALASLRATGLVVWELIRPHQRLPTGRYTRTNVCRYWVALPRLGALLEAPASRAAAPERRTPIRPAKAAANEAGKGRATDQEFDASTLPDSTTSMHRNSGASYGTTSLNEQPPPLSPPEPAPATANESPAAEREAISKSDPAVKPELAPICEAWARLGLGRIDRRSVRALENRLDDGATLEQLEAAVEGAGVDDWLRRRAKVPFAVVFANLASIERFAHEGRKLLDARAHAAKCEAEELRKEREWKKQQAAPPPVRLVTPTEPVELLDDDELPRMPREKPMSQEEFARRRAEQKAQALAWLAQNGP